LRHEEAKRPDSSTVLLSAMQADVVAVALAQSWSVPGNDPNFLSHSYFLSSGKIKIPAAHNSLFRAYILHIWNLSSCSNLTNRCFQRSERFQTPEQFHSTSSTFGIRKEMNHEELVESIVDALGRTTA
jgi:hypothetical protein